VDEQEIGFVLSIGGIASLVSQVPGGELLDATRSKRRLVVVGVVTVAVAALIFAVQPSFLLVAGAEALQGLTGGLLGPAVVAITLGLVGHAALSERLGRNMRSAAAGGLAATAATGLIPYSLSNRAIFVATVVLAVPTVVALSRIGADQIHFPRSCAAEPCHPDRVQRAARGAVLWNNPGLLTFAACAVLFPLANASMLPLVGEQLAYMGRPHVVSALIIVPELVVTFLAPWVGRRADSHGRKPLLLAGFARDAKQLIIKPFCSVIGSWRMSSKPGLIPRNHPAPQRCLSW
jgi:MFS family permease